MLADFSSDEAHLRAGCDQAVGLACTDPTTSDNEYWHVVEVEEDRI